MSELSCSRAACSRWQLQQTETLLQSRLGSVRARDARRTSRHCLSPLQAQDFVIKPSSVKPSLDTSQWPLLLKVSAL